MDFELESDLGPVAFFCSQACPGDIILKAQDWANAQQPNGPAIISGFHTPVERDVLRILIRRQVPIIFCLGRGLPGFRRSLAIREAEGAGRLKIISPFSDAQRRTTAATAEARNEFIVTQSETVLIAHASQAGKTEALAHRVLAAGKQLLALHSPNNASLVALGAVEVDF